VPSRGRKTLLSLAVSSVACALVLAGPVAVSADPAAELAKAQASAAQADQSVTAAKAELDKLDEQLGMVDEQYAQAKLAQEASQQRATALSADVAGRQSKVDALRKQAADFARASFQTAGVDTTTQLFVSGNPDSFLQQISTVAKVDENMNDVLQRFQSEQANLDDLKRSADAEVAAASEAVAKMADLEAQGKKNVEDSKALLASLTDAQRAVLDSVDAAKAAVAPAATSTTSSSATSSSSSTSKASLVTGSGGAPSSAAAQALSYAMAHVGYPYVWAAAGPDSFDCSGLMVAAYASAGISIPHSSGALSQMYTPVSRADLRPGDLIFWYSPVHHVAMYAGNGMMVHAQNPKLGVLVSPVDQWLGWGIPYSGARRVVG
jgi:peptidoglycan DL-endopeptidase CwlO